MGEVEISFENTSDAEQKFEAMLVISPSRADVYKNIPYSFSIKKGEIIKIKEELELFPGKQLLHIESGNPNVLMSWVVIENPLILEEDIDAAPVMNIIDCRGNIAADVQLALKDGWLIIKSEHLKKNAMTIYSTQDYSLLSGQVFFSIEETDFGMSPAIINGRNGLELSPQLRCPAEITNVFKNEPKVDKINSITVSDKINGISMIDLKTLGVENESGVFRIEISAESDIKKRYPICLFSSQLPERVCHMFALVKGKD